MVLHRAVRLTLPTALVSALVGPGCTGADDAETGADTHASEGGSTGASTSGSGSTTATTGPTTSASTTSASTTGASTTGSTGSDEGSTGKETDTTKGSDGSDGGSESGGVDECMFIGDKATCDADELCIWSEDFGFCIPDCAQYPDQRSCEQAIGCFWVDPCLWEGEI